MKMDYRWIALLLLALAAGHLSGRWVVGTAPDLEAEKSSRAANGAEGRSARSPARSNRRSQRHTNSRNMSRQRQLERIMGDFYEGNYDFDDPFAASGIRVGKDHSAWSRLCAWVMSASRSDFPTIMDMAQGKGNDATVDRDVMKLLLQRWVEFDPDAAVAWLKARQSGENEELFLVEEMFLVQEAMLYHPAWAAEALKNLHQSISKYNESYDPELWDDPFGDSGISMDFNLFFWRLSALPEAQRNAIVSSLENKLLDYGVDGWMKGMVAHGGEQDIARMYQQAVKADNMYDFHGAFKQYAAKDWKAARDFVENQRANNLDAVVWERWVKEDKESANLWLLDRATDAKARENRIASIADKFEDVDKQQAWIAQMEARGEPVTKALSELVGDMKTSGRLNEAMQLVSKLPQQKQEEARGQIYAYVTDSNWFRTTGQNSVEYVIPDKKHAGFYNQYPEFREYVRQSNEAAIRELPKLFKLMKADFGLRPPKPDQP